MTEILGVDIWGTIWKLNTYEGEMIPDAFPALKQLVDKRFGKQVWLVSAAQTGESTLYSLKKQNFYEETGILPEHVKFCRIWEKASLYDKLGITHVIDDNDVILTQLNTARYRYLFKTEYSLGFMVSEEIMTSKDTLKLKGIQIVTSWKEVLSILLPKEAGR